MLRIGLRAHDYGRLPPETLADTLTAFKPASIQLALSKAFPQAPGLGGLSPGYAQGIRRIFETRHIAIAVLGCYINPVHPDPVQRDLQLRRFEEHLRFARDFGCSIVGTETGSPHPDCGRHPDTQSPKTLDLLCASLERLLKTAEKCGSIVGVEGVADQHTIHSIEAMGTLLTRLRSPSLKVIYDPVNLIPQKGLEETQSAFFNRAFEVFGEDIAVIHAKDFRIVQDHKQGDLPAGTGDLDYKALLRIILEKKPGIDILLENTTPAQGRRTIAFLHETAQILSL